MRRRRKPLGIAILFNLGKGYRKNNKIEFVKRPISKGIWLKAIEPNSKRNRALFILFGYLIEPP